jgi:hypothetical protein
MAALPLYRLVLLGCLLGGGSSVAAIDPTPPRLLLHDFERPTSPVPGTIASAWSADPEQPAGRIVTQMQAAPAPRSGRALHLAYRFAPGADDAIDISFHEQLQHGFRHRPQKIPFASLLQKLHQWHPGIGHRGLLGCWCCFGTPPYNQTAR